MSAEIKFTKKEYGFISAEFDIKKVEIDKYTEDDFWGLQDKCADIEVEEIIVADKAEDDDLSERGEIAASIVTKIGNAFSDKED